MSSRSTPGWHHEIWKCTQSSGEVHLKVVLHRLYLQNLLVTVFISKAALFFTISSASMLPSTLAALLALGPYVSPVSTTHPLSPHTRPTSSRISPTVGTPCQAVPSQPCLLALRFSSRVLPDAKGSSVLLQPWGSVGPACPRLRSCAIFFSGASPVTAHKPSACNGLHLAYCLDSLPCLEASDDRWSCSFMMQMVLCVSGPSVWHCLHRGENAIASLPAHQTPRLC